MNNLVFILTLIVLCTKTGLSQTHQNTPFTFQSEKSTYLVGDTIQVKFHLDSLMILCSNFGGCGGGPFYFIKCHSDSLLSRNCPPSCSYLLMEYDYIKQGTFDFIIQYPGTYSFNFYVKKDSQQEIREEDRYKYTIASQLVTVIGVKK